MLHARTPVRMQGTTPWASTNTPLLMTGCAPAVSRQGALLQLDSHTRSQRAAGSSSTQQAIQWLYPVVFWPAASALEALGGGVTTKPY